MMALKLTMVIQLLDESIENSMNHSPKFFGGYKFLV